MRWALVGLIAFLILCAAYVLASAQDDFAFAVVVMAMLGFAFAIAKNSI